MFDNIPSKQIARAAQLKAQIENLQLEIERLLGQGSLPASKASSAFSGQSARKGQISAEGKARIIAAQKARWAKYRKQMGKTADSEGKHGGAASGGKSKRTMSAAARAKIRAAAKARWAKAKAAGRNAL